MLLSLIVPVYNVSKYLPETLKSIRDQSLQDMEVLCIDDHSTDGSWDILVEAVSHDPRIRLLQQEKNMGVGLARKRAVSESKGKYIMFLDGDDALMNDACQKLVELMEKKPVDILHFGTTIKSESNISAEEEQNFNNFSKPHPHFIERPDLYNACFHEHLFGFTLWNKIYKGNIVRKAFKNFPDVRMDIAEDLLVFFMITCFSKTYGFVDEKFYVYNFGGGITGGKAITLKQMHQYAQQGDTLHYLDQFLAQHGWKEKCSDARNWVCENSSDAAIFNWLFGIGQAQATEAFNIIFPHFNSEDLLRSCVKGLHEWGLQPKSLAERLKNSNAVLPKKRTVKTIATYYFRAYNGGVERVMTKLADIWDEMGYRVLIITDETVNEDDYAYSPKVSRICLNDMKAADTNPFTSRLLNICRVLKQYQVDLFVYHAWCSPNILWDILATKMAGSAMLVHTHNLFSQGYRAKDVQFPMQAAMLGFYYELVDGIVTLTDVDTAWWSLWHSNVFRTNNPIPWEYKEISSSPPQNHDILWIGRISYEKQPLCALQILKEVQKKIPDAILHFVGSADDKEYYQCFLAEIERLELKNSVILHGFQNDVQKYYEQCQLYLCTSLYEGFCLTIAESKLKARPCVTFDLENLDMVREGRGMCVVPQGDIVSAATAVTDILHDPILWKQLSSEAHESIRAICEFSQTSLWEKIISVISNPSHPCENASVKIAVRMQANDLITCFHLLGHEIKYYREAFEWNKAQYEFFHKETMYYTERCKILEQQLNSKHLHPIVKPIITKKIKTFFRCLKDFGVKETLKIARDKLLNLMK